MEGDFGLIPWCDVNDDGNMKLIPRIRRKNFSFNFFVSS